MRVVRAARLHLRDATSDKVYDVDLIENEALGTPERYFVNTRYGRRGATLREGSKTPQPLTAEAAARVFDSVIVAKINGGYRRIDGPEPSAASEPSADGRAAVLRARLSACLHQRWPERERDRLLWRIGELRLAAAAPDLIALARALGPAQASYALVWALARAAGAEAGPILDAIAADAPGSVVRDLARFALAAPLTGAYRPPEAEPDLPGMVARPAEAGDVDGLCGALDGLARHDPGRVGPALVALGRLAQGRPALHATLCAALLRLPARPPYLIGLRRLFKHAEMADDAALFGAAAQRFETAQAMYQAGRSHAYVPDLRRYVAVDAARHGPEARLGLSTATRAYMKRRIWRALRKRGAVGDPAFTALATGFLLALGPEDLDPPTRWTAWGRKPDGTWGRQARARGPLGRNWTASQLLYRHAPEARPRTGSLTFLETGAVDPDRRDEAFRISGAPVRTWRSASPRRGGSSRWRGWACGCCARTRGPARLWTPPRSGASWRPRTTPCGPSPSRSPRRASPPGSPIPPTSPPWWRRCWPQPCRRRGRLPCGASRPGRRSSGRIRTSPPRCSRARSRMSRRRSRGSPGRCPQGSRRPWSRGWWRGCGRCRRSPTPPRRPRSGACAPPCPSCGRTTTCRCSPRLPPP